MELPGQSKIEPGDTSMNGKSEFAVTRRNRNTFRLGTIDPARDEPTRCASSRQINFVSRFTVRVRGEAKCLTCGEGNWKGEARFVAGDDFGDNFVSAYAEVLPDSALLSRGHA